MFRVFRHIQLLSLLCASFFLPRSLYWPLSHSNGPQQEQNPEPGCTQIISALGRRAGTSLREAPAAEDRIKLFFFFVSSLILQRQDDGDESQVTSGDGKETSGNMKKKKKKVLGLKKQDKVRSKKGGINKNKE
ncbi:Hypothetical protein SMAX5B_017235 [Scophthalmus maximus]|uniref:Secreted protein n=1 Tax=Scophthalmus maximus TaxID=52904 RepID=A0A2U9C689_SCOMX|nr:Hypothetical protein SMAX5B_017235 [Scophthalmus maximus]